MTMGRPRPIRSRAPAVSIAFSWPQLTKPMNRRPLQIILAVLAILPAAKLRAEDPYTNRFTLSARFGFNVSARFGGVSGLTAPTSAARTTPRGDQYNYDNGYV